MLPLVICTAHFAWRYTCNYMRDKNVHINPQLHVAVTPDWFLHNIVLEIAMYIPAKMPVISCFSITKLETRQQMSGFKSNFVSASQINWGPVPYARLTQQYIYCHIAKKVKKPQFMTGYVWLFKYHTYFTKLGMQSKCINTYHTCSQWFGLIRTTGGSSSNHASISHTVLVSSLYGADSFTHQTVWVCICLE